MLLLTGAVLGALAGRLAGGSFWNVAKLRFRWPLVVLLALVIKEVALFTPMSTSPTAALVYILSLWMLLAWTLWHRDVLPGIWIISLGMAMNLLVVAANLGHMPAQPWIVARQPVLAARLLHDRVVGQYILADSTTHLNWLGDTIALPGLVGRIYPQAYSAGDLVALVGVFVVAALAVAPDLLLNRRQLPIDVLQTRSELIVTASVAGFEPADIHIAAEERALTIEAVSRHAVADAARALKRHERLGGSLRRRVRLPARVDAARAEATVRSGVLRVTLPLDIKPARRVPVVDAQPPPQNEAWPVASQSAQPAVEWPIDAEPERFVDSEPSRFIDSEPDQAPRVRTVAERAGTSVISRLLGPRR